MMALQALCYAVLLLAQAVSSEMQLSPLQEIERMRQNATTIERQGNLDVLQTSSSSTSTSICHLVALLPLTTLDGSATRQPFTSVRSLQGVAATLLAISHINTGNGSIIPEIAQMPQKCPQLKLSTEILDSQLDERKAIDHVIGVLERDPVTTSQPIPCSFIGAYRSAVSMPTSIITGLQGYPQFAALSTSSALDDPDQFPLAGRLNPSDDGTAVAAILYLQSLQVDHLAVIHTTDAYGNAYANGLIEAASIHAPQMQIISIDLPYQLEKAGPEVLERRVQSLKDTGFRYFFGIIFDALHYDSLMLEAYQQGIAGTGEHQWIFSDGVGVGRMTGRNYTKGSPLFLASRGTGMITTVGGLPSKNDVMGPYDKLSVALRELQGNSEDIKFLNSKLPIYEDHPTYSAQSVINDPNFLKQPGLLAPFLYDTVVTLALSACEVISTGGILTGTDHFATAMKSHFVGTSGQIALNPATGTRNATSALFTLTNFVEAATQNGGDEFTKIEAVAAEVFKDGAWTTLEAYTFNDGTTNIPPGLPPSELDENHIAPAARVLILLLGCLSLGLSVSFAAWTLLHKRNRVVRASQPIFLYIICIGTFFMGGAVLLLGVDDGIISLDTCQVACIVFPWLLCLGFALTTSALFTKTHRINLIVNQRHFRRVSVSALDVMKPMFCLVGLNTLVLILWHVLETPEWTREETEYDAFGRLTESLASCTYPGGLPYIISLAVINMGAILYACYEAYLAREISTEYAESEYIVKSMVAAIVLCFIGIPVAILTQDNPTAFNCVLAGVVFACSLSFQLYIFVPKIKFNSMAVRTDSVGTSREKPANRLMAQVFRSKSNSQISGMGSQSQSSFASTLSGLSAGIAAAAGGNGVASFSSHSSSAEILGVRVYNRRQIQFELQLENTKLLKENRKLKQKIRKLYKKNGYKDDDDVESDTSKTKDTNRLSHAWRSKDADDTTNHSIDQDTLERPQSMILSIAASEHMMVSSQASMPSYAVSDAESVIEIDPLDHEDETSLPACPFDPVSTKEKSEDLVEESAPEGKE